MSDRTKEILALAGKELPTIHYNDTVITADAPAPEAPQDQPRQADAASVLDALGKIGLSVDQQNAIRDIVGAPRLAPGTPEATLADVTKGPGPDVANKPYFDGPDPTAQAFANQLDKDARNQLARGEPVAPGTYQDASPLSEYDAALSDPEGARILMSNPSFQLQQAGRAEGPEIMGRLAQASVPPAGGNPVDNQIDETMRKMESRKPQRWGQVEGALDRAMKKRGQ